MARLFRPQPPALSGTRGFEDSSPEAHLDALADVTSRAQPTAKAELLNASFSACSKARCAQDLTSRIRRSSTSGAIGVVRTSEETIRDPKHPKTLFPACPSEFSMLKLSFGAAALEVGWAAAGLASDTRSLLLAPTREQADLMVA